MALTILVVGATGNTGRGVVETLSKLRDSNKVIAGYRIIALTRSSESPAAKKLSALPGVELIEQTWVEITADWLRQHEVVRVFIASHNQPNQFAEESNFYVAALQAGVKYVVRISTTAANVRPDIDVYYPRSHWAIEALLSSPEFEKLQWSSLQPNGFSDMVLASAAEHIKEYRKTGQQSTVSLILNADTPTGIIDPREVGVFAAHLLAQEDTTAHNKAKYVLNGPEDITGEQIIAMVEERTGTRVENVKYKDLSFIDDWAATTQESKNVILSIKRAPATSWAGLATTSTTSKEVLELAPPTRTPKDVLDSLLNA